MYCTRIKMCPTLVFTSLGPINDAHFWRRLRKLIVLTPTRVPSPWCNFMTEQVLSDPKWGVGDDDDDPSWRSSIAP